MQPLLLTDGLVALGCDPAHGFVITSLVDRVSGADALWSRAGHEPVELRRWLGAGGSSSVETFLDLFVGGWFMMAPTVGFPAAVPGPVGEQDALLHGEACRLPWIVETIDAVSVTARLALVRSPFVLRRSIRVDGGRVTVTTVVHNPSFVPVRLAYGEHPCLARSTFAGGRVILDAAAAASLTVGPDGRSRPSAIPWPHTAAALGRDYAAIPQLATGVTDQVAFDLRSGEIVVTAPAKGRAFHLLVDPTVFPYALGWFAFRPAEAGMWGAADTFAIEPATSPGRGVADVPEVAWRWLAPGTSERFIVAAWWSDSP